MKIDPDAFDIQDWASKSSEEIQKEIDRLEIINAENQ
jgi:hypothetical protein